MHFVIDKITPFFRKNELSHTGSIFYLNLKKKRTLNYAKKIEIAYIIAVRWNKNNTSIPSQILYHNVEQKPV